jgi:carbonic anhydrase/acetyltransferase-like protein (isoleucine patch superfamily)
VIRSFKESVPQIDGSAFIAETAVIIGDVVIGPGANIWYGVTMRGDINRIEIGREVNIQENSVVHVDAKKDQPDFGRTVIADRVTIGHGAIIHACHIEEDCLIGMGAIILSGARIGQGSVIAAGAVVKEGQIIPPHSLAAGVPAAVKGTVPEEKIAGLRRHAASYRELSEEHRRFSRVICPS